MRYIMIRDCACHDTRLKTGHASMSLMCHFVPIRTRIQPLPFFSVVLAPVAYSSRRGMATHMDTFQLDMFLACTVIQGQGLQL